MIYFLIFSFLASLYMISLFKALGRIKTVIAGMQRERSVNIHLSLLDFSSNTTILRDFYSEKRFTLILFIRVSKAKLEWFQPTLSFFLLLLLQSLERENSECE